MYEVSVVILSYNFEKYIKRAIDSVLMQVVDFDYEIIIGDDCSTDNTRAILKKYESKHPNLVRLILKDENIGSTRLMYDILTTECRGRYVINFDGDDYWTDPNKLVKQKIFLDNHPEFVGVGHVIELKDFANNTIGFSPKLKNFHNIISIEQFLRGSIIHSTTILYRNIYSSHAGEYRIMYEASRYQGDFTRCMILLNISDISIMNDAMSVYCVRNKADETNFNSVFNWTKKMEIKISLLKANYEYFEGKYDLSYLTWDTILFCLFLSIKYNQINKFPGLYKSVPKHLKIHKYNILPICLKMFKFLSSRIILIFQRKLLAK